MAFYYGWWGGPPNYRHWAMATGNPSFAHDPSRVVATGPRYRDGVRRDVAAKDYPALGPYSSFNAAVVDRHLAWARHAGIDVLIFSWWGPGTYEDRALRFLLERIKATRSPIRVAVYLETRALLDPGLFRSERLRSALSDGPPIVDQRSREQLREKAANWLSYVLTRYGNRHGFAHVARGRARVPLIFVYHASRFQPYEWLRIFHQVRRQTGTNAFYQAEVGGIDPRPMMRAFDGIHVYNPAAGLAVGADVRGFYQALAKFARGHRRSWSATVIPGFDDRMVRAPGTVVARNRGGARTYDRLWGQALASRPDWVLITSFNEWHEGSEIEPSFEYSNEFLRRTRKWVRRIHHC